MGTYLNADNDLDRLLLGQPTDALVKRGQATHEGPTFKAPEPIPEALPMVGVMYNDHCQHCSHDTRVYGYAYRQNLQGERLVVDGRTTAIAPALIKRWEFINRNVPMCMHCTPTQEHV